MHKSLDFKESLQYIRLTLTISVSFSPETYETTSVNYTELGLPLTVSTSNIKKKVDRYRKHLLTSIF